MAALQANRFLARGIVLAGALLLGAGGSSAQAGCEDHAIIYGAAARAEQAGQHRLNDQVHPNRFHHSQPGQKKPCNGPSCSRQSPHSPLLPSNDPPKKTSDDPILASWLDSLLFVESPQFPPCLTAAALPAGHTDGLLDPPRA